MNEIANSEYSGGEYVGEIHRDPATEKAQAEAAKKFERNAAREHRQQMKLQCISLAQAAGAIYNETDKVMCDHEKVLEAAKAYYEFVRT